MSFQLILIFSFICQSLQLLRADSPTYVAGVVEYLIDQGNSSMVSRELFRRNAEKYIEIMSSQEATKVDIIVFPKSTLNSILTAVIVPQDNNTDLCHNTIYDLYLRRIACTAKKLRKYVVINLTMKKLEPNCNYNENRVKNCTDDWNLYNTNVVLDRDVRVISLYRKYNLYRESSITKPSTPDISTFTTDFNVTFGHIICFDLLFKSPAQDLVDKGINNIIYTALWFSELPFLTAVQIQQSWAYANNVNMLGSGANRPIYGSGGSGIFSGTSGSLSSIMTGDAVTRLIVHEIPKVPGTYIQNASATIGENFDNLRLTQDQLDGYHYRKINLTTLNNISICHESVDDIEEDFCCNFEIEASIGSVENYSVYNSKKTELSKHFHLINNTLAYRYYCAVKHK